MSAHRILYVVNDATYFVSHRSPIAHAARAQGYEIRVACTGDSRAIEAMGYRHHPIPLDRGLRYPWEELRALLALYRVIREFRPHLIHLVTLKPVLYGGILARWCGIPAVVSAVAGLGLIFSDTATLKNQVLRKLALLLFRFAFGHPNQKIVFQNPDDLEQLSSATGIPAWKTALIHGSGADLNHFQALPEKNQTPVIAMASRLLRDKGVLEFVAAARLLRTKGLRARFQLIGAPDPVNPASVSARELEQWGEEGVVEILGYRTDIARLYANANIVTLPSYYREGLPKCLIEAAASGRAVITTDAAGCRHAILPEQTGLLVPPRDPEALAAAIEKLILDPALRARLGREGRLLAEQRFAIEIIVSHHLEVYRCLISRLAPS